MKEFWKTWQFWVAIAAVLLIITGFVLYFTVPAFKSVVLECAGGALIFILGAIFSWIVSRDKKK